MRLHLGRAARGQLAVHVVVETFVQLVARHDAECLPEQPAGHGESCAFDVPIAMSSIAAISS